MITKTLVKPTNIITAKKTVKISSKNQITIPKAFLNSLNLNSGDKILIDLVDGKLELINQKSKQVNKLKNFKPISLGKGIVTNIAQNHNDIYDQ